MKGEFLCESFLFSGRHRHEEDVEDTHVKTVHSDSTEFEGTIKVKAMRCEVRIFSFPELFPRSHRTWLRVQAGVPPGHHQGIVDTQ